MSHINYSFNQTDDSLPRDKMKLRNIASTRYSGDWPSIPHSHSYAELFYIVDGAGQFQINDKLFPVQAHQLVVVNPNVIHTEVSLESHPLEYIVLGIEGLEFTISDAAEGSQDGCSLRCGNICAAMPGIAEGVHFPEVAGYIGVSRQRPAQLAIGNSNPAAQSNQTGAHFLG